MTEKTHTPEKGKPEPSFEQGLERLEQIVQELEKGDLALERALELFEEGMKLSAACRKKLEEAENRVEVLLKKNDGKIVAEPFRIGEDDKPS
jgi:exodeoxyribonuclease VII small subunit